MESFCLCALLCILFYHAVDRTLYTLPFYQVDGLDGEGYRGLCVWRVDRDDGGAHRGLDFQEEVRGRKYFPEAGRI